MCLFDRISTTWSFPRIYTFFPPSLDVRWFTRSKYGSVMAFTTTSTWMRFLWFDVGALLLLFVSFCQVSTVEFFAVAVGEESDEAFVFSFHAVRLYSGEYRPGSFILLLPAEARTPINVEYVSSLTFFLSAW